MGASKSKAVTAAQREAKNWASCTSASTCNTGWACCNSFDLSQVATITTPGNIAKICVNPGKPNPQVPSNIKTYGGRFYYCSLTDAKEISGAQSLVVASALAITATYTAF